MFNYSNFLSKFYKSIVIRKVHLVKERAYVNGCWIPAASNKTFEVINPADGCVIGCVPDMTAKDVQCAVKHAYNAFQTWKEITAKERSHYLRKWYELLVNNAEHIAKIITLESGKPLIESRAEVVYGNSYVEWFSEEARRIEGEIISSPIKTKRMFICLQPIGVVALITPWNFPQAMVTRKSSAALAAGCTCVIRPSEETPLSTLALAELADQAGFPKGVFNVVTSDTEHASEIGKFFCESPIVAGISFTGSTAVGKILYKLCANRIKRISLELGGNAPFIVFKSADVDKAVQGAMRTKFRNSGQACVSVNRIYIHESIYKEFICKFKEAILGIVMGNGLKPGIQAGPLINAQHVKRVHNFVKDAINKGAKLIVGGKPAAKYGKLFYEPTLITNIKSNMLCYHEEIFGPVACCSSFKTEEEVIKISNNTEGGLAGYFYSNDIAQVFRVIQNLDVGMIGVNEGIISTTEAPFGGIKESGIGREGSKYGINEYLYIKYICLGNV